MTARASAFDQALRRLAVEALQAEDFRFDRKRTFRRAVGPAVQIVNFQLGQRSMEGRFAVNLGVYLPGDALGTAPDLAPDQAMEYHCAPQRRERLGRLLPRRLPALQDLPYVGLLFGPKDVWWPFSEDARATEASVARSLAALREYGLPWFARKTPA